MNPEIHIPNPCKANWNSMQSNEQGRFCELCQTTVIDFANLPMETLLHTLEEAARCGRSVCGRVPKAWVAPKPMHPVKRWLLRGSLWTIAALTYLSAKAQQVVWPDKQVIQQRQECSNSLQTVTLKGRLLNDSVPLPNMLFTLRINQIYHFLRTDSAGHFKVNVLLNQSDTVDTHLMVTITSLLFNTIEKRITISPNEPISMLNVNILKLPSRSVNQVGRCTVGAVSVQQIKPAAREQMRRIVQPNLDLPVRNWQEP